MEGRTEAAITELGPEARTQEIARLLGGRRITSRALAHAREMLQRGTHPKEDSGKLKRARPKASPGRNARH
jgi:DNA repair protein RecN (Recombination protein N)